jgi:hypothetical protein
MVGPIGVSELKRVGLMRIGSSSISYLSDES